MNGFLIVSATTDGVYNGRMPGLVAKAVPELVVVSDPALDVVEVTLKLHGEHVDESAKLRNLSTQKIQKNTHLAQVLIPTTKSACGFTESDLA